MILNQCWICLLKKLDMSSETADVRVSKILGSRIVRNSSNSRARSQQFQSQVVNRVFDRIQWIYQDPDSIS